MRRQVMNRRVLLGGGLAAAAGATYLAIDPPLGLWPSLSEARADFRTGTGEQRVVTFAENVSINMNTQTSLAIRHPQDGVDRIELIAGEASFATSSHTRRALAVLAAGGSAIANTARFDVRHITSDQKGAVCVTCFDGSVHIVHGANAAELQRGQQIRYDLSGLSQIATVDMESASDWQRGIVVFRATPLAEVVAEINRYRPGRIILTNAVLGKREVNGRFRINQMDDVLTRLEQAFNARIRTLPGGIMLLG
ncbi:FecR domain-containing protein [Bradyrhizobium sp. Leo121]|uniref:FecR family protein n=1 Tax=Bradyrhizobium sp. Leo121 TaxID=1571195 RepID=UPI001FE17805|nr:FecR domain-containing protein [Bradyrhizobium sp. Leo121]